MASNETSVPSMLPVPPPGTNFIAAIQPAVAYLMIGTTLGTVLVPMLLSLFFFSTRSMRRRPIFLANLIAICFGITLSLLNGYLEVHALLLPTDPVNAATFVAYGVITSTGPVLLDSILLIRLFAVFPFSRTPRLRWISVMSFPILMKIARIVNIAVFCHKEQQIVPHTSPTQGVEVLAHVINIKLEWFLQVFDNAYSSMMFLWKLFNHRHVDGRVSLSTHHSLSKSISTIFWIATSNFVFPVIFNIAQLVIFMTTADFTVCLYVQQANYFISIIGVVFATVWATGNNWAHDNVYDSEQGQSLSTLAAGPNPDHPSGPDALMPGSRGRSHMHPSSFESSSNVAASFAEAQTLDGKALDARMQVVIPLSVLGQVKDQI